MLVTFFLLIAVTVLLCFAGVLLFGAPFLPTLTPQIVAALDLLALEPGQTLLELGCGDGRVMVAAAKRGIHVVGYELNPILALIAWVRTRSFRNRARVILGNYWNQDWPQAEGVFAFILARYMSRLDRMITAQLEPPVKVASFAFQIPNKKPVNERGGIYLYLYDTSPPSHTLAKHPHSRLP